MAGDHEDCPSHRGSTHEPTIPDTPSDDTPRVSFGSDGQREDLGRIQPRDGQPSRSKSGRKDKDHARGGNSVARCRRSVSGGVSVETEPRESSSEEHNDSLNGGTPEEGFTTTDPVEREDADQGGELERLKKSVSVDVNDRESAQAHHVTDVV